jgi:hypothetical protein
MIYYKFLAAKRAFDVLESSKIRFAQLSSLNDPFESVHDMDSYITREYIFQLFNGMMNDPNLLNSAFNVAITKTYENLTTIKKYLFGKRLFSFFMRKFIAHEFEKIGTNLKDYVFAKVEENIEPTLSRIRQMTSAYMSDILCVLSLSVAKANQLMWSHYSDSHRGIAIGFDSEHPFFADAMQIIYQAERPILDFSVLPSTESEKKAFAQKWLAVKNIAWQYEEEYRLIRPSTAMELLSCSDSNGFPVYVSPFPAESVVEVILGSKSTDNDKNILKTILVSKYPNASLNKSILNQNDFQLSFQLV